jgi:hypothetical protein
MDQVPIEVDNIYNKKDLNSRYCGLAWYNGSADQLPIHQHISDRMIIIGSFIKRRHNAFIN